MAVITTAQKGNVEVFKLLLKTHETEFSFTNSAIASEHRVLSHTVTVFKWFSECWYTNLSLNVLLDLCSTSMNPFRTNLGPVAPYSLSNTSTNSIASAAAADTLVTNDVVHRTQVLLSFQRPIDAVTTG
jgi:hypothetical protein